MNRILKDSIWTSRSLAQLDDFTQDQFPRWLLMADDWGCFDVDVDVIKGLVYPKRPKVTPKVIEKVRQEFENSGHLFCWSEGDHVWGYWVSWNDHNYCSGGAVDESGARAKRRRKTPEPPAELLNQYIQQHTNPAPQAGTARNNSEQSGTKISMHDSDLDPDSDLNLDACISLANASVSAGADEQAATPIRMFEQYNALRSGLPAAAKLTREREVKCVARIRSHARDPAFFADWCQAVEMAGKLPFCCGAGSQGWIASFDWFIANDTNFRKVLEGKYAYGAHQNSGSGSGKAVLGKGERPYTPRQ